MRFRHDLSEIPWTLSGWTPFLWTLMQTMELGETPNAEIPGIPARVPGSVQQALQDAGLLPDWRVGENWRLCEWVENRQWAYETILPAEWFDIGETAELVCEGLDDRGWVYLNGEEIGAFRGSHRIHRFKLTAVKPGEPNRLRILFDLPPRWLGQFGYTSKVREPKVRFNYTWDWQPRLVQIGIWDSIYVELTRGAVFRDVRVRAGADPESGKGRLRVTGRVEAGTGCQVEAALELHGGDRIQTLSPEEFEQTGITWSDLDVQLWWPNGDGGQLLYDLRLTIRGLDGETEDVAERRVGFRHIEWRQCEASPSGADPWLCVVNGKPIFLQGVNSPPLLPNFADISGERYRKLLHTYRELGINTLRVNGVGYLEKTVFYDLCDELGLLVWQDVPLSSSGADNVPPRDEPFIEEFSGILREFIARRQHHACLLLWCGGNELHDRVDGVGIPCGLDHPLLKRFSEIVEQEDPGRRFLPSTATGPRFNADAKDFGKGLHWNVHGPWKPWDDLTGWTEYWTGDDALFRAESGAPGACDPEIIRRFTGELNPMPVSAHNPLWRRPLTWWIEAEQFQAEHGRPPETLEEYVAWSQGRQAKALVTLVSACKARFPRCGGVLLWCGHDCFPCPANTSILDYDLNPKPAAMALQRIWLGEGGDCPVR